MQVVSPSSPASKFAIKERFSELYGKLSDDLDSKLKLSSTKEENRNNKPWWNQNKTEAETNDDEERQEEEEGEGDEFSFASVNAENSPITAEEAFQNGQIRPVYPLFNRNLLFEYEKDDDDDDTNKKALRSPLKKLFVEEEEEESSEPMGPYCSWSGQTVEEASPETCRKSNSTGFSKLWRFRDLGLRSNSDGKDAFVFLRNGDGDKNRSSCSSSSSMAAKLKRTKKEKEKTKTEKKMKMKTKSAHERLYMRNRAIKEEGKRKSYLPYRHVGFFTNVNGLSRNVHPY